MRVVIAPDKFKGSLSAADAAAAMARGVTRACPGASIDRVPMADGGEGTVDALVAATAGSAHEAVVTGPFGEPVRARFGLSGDGRTAVIEMAAASGLVLVPKEKRNPLVTTTRGTGELMLAAIASGAKRLIVGIGGSATNDGGAGLGQALGFRLLDAEGRELEPGGGGLGKLSRIDASGRRPELHAIDVAVACDVTNPLCGPTGASAVYGPQKGADATMIETLDRNLAHFASIVEREPGHCHQRSARLGRRRRARRWPGRICPRQARAGHRPGHQSGRSRITSRSYGSLSDRRGLHRRSERLRQDGRRRRPPGALAALSGAGPGRLDRPRRLGRPRPRNRRLLLDLSRSDRAGRSCQARRRTPRASNRASDSRVRGRKNMIE